MNVFEIFVFVQYGVVVMFMLNWFDVCNVFNEMVIVELIGVFCVLVNELSVCVIVLLGNGFVFCVGVDLNWMKKMVGYFDDENCVDVLCLVEMLCVIYICFKFVIVCVQGDIYVGGVGLVVVCDIVVVVDMVNFCLLEVKFGLILVIISLYVICVLGEQVLCCYFIIVECFFVVEVYCFGFVYELVSVDVFDVKVVDIMVVFVVNSLNVVCESKWFVCEVFGVVVNDVLLVDIVECIVVICVLEEGCEGVQSFLGKCKLNWLLLV